jgi:hypothetical protein
MEKFLNDITTIYWWISVVIVGVAINLFSGVIPKLFSLFSKSVQTAVLSKNKKAREKYEKDVCSLVEDPELIIYRYIRCQANRILTFIL